MLLSVLWLLPEFTPGGNDREIFRCIGRSIGNGLLPYKDYFDHKPPFIYLIFYLTAFAGEWDVFLAGTLFLFISIFVIKSIVQPKNTIGQWLIPVFLLIWLRNPLFYEYGGLTREYTAYLYCIFFFMVAGNLKIGWLYLITGLVFITQQNDILPLLPLLIYKTSTQGKLKTSGIFLHILLFFLSLALASIWLLANSAFQNFSEQAFLFNFNYYSKPLSALHPEALIRLANQFVQKINFGIIGLALLLIFHLVTKRISYSLIILLTVFLGILNVVISGRFYGHYFLPLGPILAFAFIALDADTGSKIKTLAITLGISSFIVSIMWDNRHFNLSEQKLLAEDNRKVLMQMETIIQSNIAGLKHINAINYSPAFPLYAKYKTSPGSPYIYFSPWDEIPGWDPDLKRFTEFIHAINKPGTLVFDFTPHHPFVRNEMNIGLAMALSQNLKQVGKILDTKGKTLAIVYQSDFLQ